MEDFEKLKNIDKYHYIKNKYPTTNITYSLINKNIYLINPEEPINNQHKIVVSNKQLIYLQKNQYVIDKSNINTFGDVLLKLDPILFEKEIYHKYLEYFEIVEDKIICYLS